MKILKTKFFCEKKYILVSVILWILISCTMSLTFDEEWRNARLQNNYVSIFSGNSSEEEIRVGLKSGDVIRQTLKMTTKKITGISLFFEAEELPQKGLLEIDIVNVNTSETVANWQKQVKEIPMGEFCDFILKEPVAIEGNGQYEMCLTLSDTDENSLNTVAVASSRKWGVKMSVNGEDVEYAMKYRIINGNHNVLRYVAIAFYAGMSTAIFLVVLLFLKKVRIEWIFVVVILVLGGLYLFALPPYTVPDEASHFVTTYAHSSRILGEQILDENGYVIVEDKNLWGADQCYPSKGSYARTIYGALGKTMDLETGPVSSRTPLEMRHPGYLPQVIGVTLGRLLNVNSTQLLLIGKIFSLIFYAFIMYWAIKLLPFGKMPLFVIGSLPMTLQMIVSYNYDSTLLGVCFFTVAYLLHLIYRERRVGFKQIVLLSILGMIIASIKFIYLPILGLALFIPKEKFGSRKIKIIAALIVLGLCTATLLYLKLSMIQYVSAPRETYSTNPGEAITIGYMLQNLRYTLEVFYRTFEHQLSFYVSGMVASPLGWLEIWIPDIIVYGFVFILMLSVIGYDTEAHEISVGFKLFGWIITFGMAILALMALLLDCTNVGATQIAGFQGRYWLPILPMILILFRNQVIVFKKRVDKYLVLALCYLHCVTIFHISLTIIGR